MGLSHNTYARSGGPLPPTQRFLPQASTEGLPGHFWKLPASFTETSAGRAADSAASCLLSTQGWLPPPWSPSRLLWVARSSPLFIPELETPLLFPSVGRTHGRRAR